jgi:hypothetical protein
VIEMLRFREDSVNTITCIHICVISEKNRIQRAKGLGLVDCPITIWQSVVVRKKKYQTSDNHKSLDNKTTSNGKSYSALKNMTT